MAKTGPETPKSPKAALCKAAASGNVKTLRRLIHTALCENVLTPACVQAVLSGLTPKATDLFVQNLDLVCGKTACTATTPSGAEMTLSVTAFTITVTGPADDIDDVILNRLDAFTKLPRISGFIKPDTNVLLTSQPYTLSDLAEISPQSVFDGCREVMRISAVDTKSAGAFNQILPVATPMPIATVVTRTFLGFTFRQDAGPIGAEDGNLHVLFNDYERAAEQVFGDDCIVGTPVAWEFSIENALSMRIEDVMDKMGEDFVPDTVEITRTGAKTTFRIFAQDDLDLAVVVSVPTAATLRCPADLEGWAEEILDITEPFYDEDDEPPVDDEDIRSFFENLNGPEDAPEVRADDTTNLVPFKPRNT